MQQRYVQAYTKMEHSCFVRIGNFDCLTSEITCMLAALFVETHPFCINEWTLCCCIAIGLLAYFLQNVNGLWRLAVLLYSIYQPYAMV